MYAGNPRKDKGIQGIIAAVAVGLVIVAIVVTTVVRKKRKSMEVLPREVLVDTGSAEGSLEDLFADYSSNAPEKKRQAQATKQPAVTVGKAARKGQATPRKATAVEELPDASSAQVGVLIGAEGKKPSTQKSPKRERTTPAKTAPSPPPRPGKETIEVPSNTPVSPPSAARTYTVQPGDTLRGIAEAFYGDGSLYTMIMKKNGIKDPRKLKIGQKLIIPPKGGGEPVTAVADVRGKRRKVSTATAARGTRRYVVKRNDSLWKIAEKVYGDGGKWRVIYEANRKTLESKDDLKVGEVLVIPSLQEGKTKP